jgi:integrase
MWVFLAFRLEARVGIEPTYKGFADLSLTTWVPRQFNNYCVFTIGHCTLDLYTLHFWIEDSMEIAQLINSNRRPRKQKGQRIETPTSWMLRYYVDGRQKCITLAPKSDLYRSWTDVEPLIERTLDQLNSQAEIASGTVGLIEYVEKYYLPWAQENKAAVTADTYDKVWARSWKPSFAASLKLTDLRTSDVTAVLTRHAKKGLGSRTLSHCKWFLSGVYEHAIASGVVPKNPVPEAKWLVKVERPKKQTEYSLEQVLAMLRILEPLDLRAAVAVGLTYFAALRPAEARGLKWEDYDGAELQVRRSVWRDKVGQTKTEDSAASVPVIEPLRSLLEKLKAQSPEGYILQNTSGEPLSLDSLNIRVITPAMEKAGIVWRGYYPGRRGISSLLTNSSKNILNATGLLRHSNSGTTARHYTQPQKAAVEAAMKAIEEMAADLTVDKETIH